LFFVREGSLSGASIAHRFVGEMHTQRAHAEPLCLGAITAFFRKLRSKYQRLFMTSIDVERLSDDLPRAEKIARSLQFACA
jgi:hypothetical protein